MLEDKTLHITNGDSFTNRLQNLLKSPTILTWNEMLCEGPTLLEVGSEAFVNGRINFLTPFGATKKKYEEFTHQFSLLENGAYNQIYLWFEYDLFCHVNLAAVVALLEQKNIEVPIYLICSGAIANREGLFALNELSDPELQSELANKLLLGTSEKSALSTFWKIYCSDDHRPFNNFSVPNTLPYLQQCVTAHLERFPSMMNGLNKLERMVLEKISEEKFKTTKELVRHLLKDQEYYGFGDLQWFSIVEQLDNFIEKSTFLTISEEGIPILYGESNTKQPGNLAAHFGGTTKYEYLYNTEFQRIEKA